MPNTRCYRSFSLTFIRDGGTVAVGLHSTVATLHIAVLRDMGCRHRFILVRGYCDVCMYHPACQFIPLA